jgi:drug/metabolite transporter (DMT)-like permease
MSWAALGIAVPSALVAAAAFGLTGALQHQAARRTPEDGTVRVGLLWALLRQPLWLASLLANGLGVVAQWVALSTGPLVLVQPLLVTGLVFAVCSSSVLARRRPDRVVLAGAGLCVAGLAMFLLLARPTSGDDVLGLGAVLPLAAGLAVILAICLVVAARHPGSVRALSLATATGVLYGVTAGLTKLTADDLRHGVAATFADWPVYGVVCCGVSGFVLSQNAFRVGVALSPALAVIVALDPLVSIGIGALWLSERLTGGPLAILGQVVALGAVIGGIFVLSRRAPQVAAQAEQGARVPHPTGGLTCPGPA